MESGNSLCAQFLFASGNFPCSVHAPHASHHAIKAAAASMNSIISSRTLSRAQLLHQTTNNTKRINMNTNMKNTLLVLAFVLMIAGLFNAAEATYRKPPFNGSIFGKRGLNQDYDAAGKTLSAMCEIASEACQAWFPQQEK